jgi:ABC-type molybdate transport system substrate-binding protein
VAGVDSFCWYTIDCFVFLPFFSKKKKKTFCKERRTLLLDALRTTGYNGDIPETVHKTNYYPIYLWMMAENMPEADQFSDMALVGAFS